MKYPEDYINKVHCADCLEFMKEIPDKTIDMILTSPPYDNLRNYNGYTFNFEGIAKELFRIVKDAGICVWVVGDAVVDGSESGTSFKQALYFKEIGFRLHDTMIYQKHNFSNPSNNRYHQIFEYMFVFSKGKPIVFNPIIDRENIEAGKIGSWGRNTKRQKDGSFKENKRNINKNYGKRYNVWRIKTEMKPLHPAQFPEKLAQDHIISWSNIGDIVLDCFNGSGTTTSIAKQLGRKFIGIEISPEYCKIAEDRLIQEVLF